MSSRPDDVEYAAQMQLGEVYMARSARHEDRTEFVFSVTRLPDEEKAGLQAFGQQKFALYADAHFGAKMSDFLRDTNYLFNHYLLNARGETVKTEGKVVLPASTEMIKPAAAIGVAAPPA